MRMIGPAQLAIVFLVAGGGLPVRGESIATACKVCTKPGSPACFEKPEDTPLFTLTKTQSVKWHVDYVNCDDPGKAGRTFIVVRDDRPEPGKTEFERNVFSKLPKLVDGSNGGFAELKPGAYHIITEKNGDVGAGTYTVSYNRTSAIEASSVTTYDFDGKPTKFSFRVKATGDLASTLHFAGIEDVTAGGAAHFKVTNVSAIESGELAVGFTRDIDVEFIPGDPAGNHKATIRIEGGDTDPDVDNVARVSVVFTVSGTTAPKVACKASACAPPDIVSFEPGVRTETFDHEIRNAGTSTLHASVQLETNADPACNAAVTLTGGSPRLFDIAPGKSASVRIDFKVAAGELKCCGNLVIDGDPAKPAFACPYAVRSHHPTPKLRVEVKELDFSDVEVRLTRVLKITVYNDGDGVLGLRKKLGTASSACPEPFVLDPIRIDECNRFKGPARCDFGVLFAPCAIGEHSSSLTIEGSDGTSPPFATATVELKGRGIAPIPIDLMLVVDRSGSMFETASLKDEPRRKIEALQTAANLAVDILKASADDAVGVVRFNDKHNLLVPFESLAVPGHLELLHETLDPESVRDDKRLWPDGGTAIADAMEEAAAVLAPRPPDRKHVMIVLTDGKETAGKRVKDVIGPIDDADPLLRRYSIGLGHDVDETLLPIIASVGNGYWQSTKKTKNEDRFALETFFMKALSNAGEKALVRDPTEAVYVGGGVATATLVAEVDIVSSDRDATFVIVDDPVLRLFYDVRIYDPYGRLLGDSFAGVPVETVSRDNYTITRVTFPDPFELPEHRGRWRIFLASNGIWHPGRDLDSYLQHQYGGFREKDSIDPYAGLVPIAAMVTATSDYRMEVSALPDNSHPGVTIALDAQFVDRGLLSRGIGIVVDVLHPSGRETRGVSLVPLADGTWSAPFIDTAEEGVYRFFFRGIGLNDRGELPPREETRYVLLLSEGKRRIVPRGN